MQRKSNNIIALVFKAASKFIIFITKQVKNRYYDVAKGKQSPLRN